MALPDTITMITVSGAYFYPDGSAAIGWLTFTPSIPARTAGGIVATGERFTVEQMAAGVRLASTTDPQWTAPGWTYLVSERLEGAPTRTYSIEVPHDGGPLDLALVAPVVSPLDVTPYVLASQLGQPGGPAGPLDEDGLIPAEQLPGGSGEAVAWTSITGKPATFPPTLPITVSGVTGLQAALTALTPLTTFDDLETEVGALATDVAGIDVRVSALEDAPGGGGVSTVVRRLVRTSGDISAAANAGWTIMAGPSLALPAAAGDEVECIVSCMFNHTGATDFWELVAVNGSSITRYGSTGSASPGTEGDPSVYPDLDVLFRGGVMVLAFQVEAGDVVAGDVTFKLAQKGTGNAAAKVYAETDYPFRMVAKNYGSAA